MFSAVILMAGIGKRCNLGHNKVLEQINDKYIFEYSIESFKKVGNLDDIVLVVNQQDQALVSEVIKKYDNIKIVLGGSVRMDSAYNGVKAANCDIVLIHDAARCLIKPDDIEAIYQLTIEHQAALGCNKIFDTIKKHNNRYIKETIDRESLLIASTPQGVEKKLYMESYKRARLDNAKVGDDVTLIEKYTGVSVYFHLLQNINLKITTKDDLDYVKYLLGK